jgi:hypothetical protein
MITGYEYSKYELDTKKCFKCGWLEMKDGWEGNCTCNYNKIKNRNRLITSRKCQWKSKGTKLRADFLCTTASIHTFNWDNNDIFIIKGE